MVTLICGRICCGKTTYAKKLCREQGAVLLSVDEIMLAVFGPYAGERHDEYAANIRRYLLEKSAELTRAGVDTVLDWGFWTREGRAAARDFFSARGIPCQFLYLDVDEDTWRARVKKRNAAVLAGEAGDYYIDDHLAAKFLSRFEAPERNEIDLWIA